MHDSTHSCFHRLFFGGLAPEMTDAVLRRMIEDITRDANAILDIFVNNEKAFAFVDFVRCSLSEHLCANSRVDLLAWMKQVTRIPSVGGRA